MIPGVRKSCCAVLRINAQNQLKYSSVNYKEECRGRKNLIFNTELEKQKANVGRVEKISVKFLLQEEGKEVELKMNKNLSTPNDCTLHISEFVNKTGALALVNDVPWDMHKPLEEDCTVKVLSMQMPSLSNALNMAFWRTGSLILGSMIDQSFKDNIPILLHSFTWPNLRSGSFVCDAVIDVPDWKPTDAEMRALSAQFVKIATSALPVERLRVKEEIALDMFMGNPFKCKQIPEIANSQDGNVTLYRIGEHIDISKGPMVGNTSIIGKATVTAVNKIKPDQVENLYRFQGIALPRGVFLNHFAYGIIEDRAKKLNRTGLQFKEEVELSDFPISEVNVAQN